MIIDNFRGFEKKAHKISRQMRCLTIFTVAISSFIVVMAIITVPLLYSYINNLQNHLAEEADFCKARKIKFFCKFFHKSDKNHNDFLTKKNKISELEIIKII